jgi:hypothetical protein
MEGYTHLCLCRNHQKIMWFLFLVRVFWVAHSEWQQISQFAIMFNQSVEPWDPITDICPCSPDRCVYNRRGLIFDINLDYFMNGTFQNALPFGGLPKYIYIFWQHEWLCFPYCDSSIFFNNHPFFECKVLVKPIPSHYPFAVAHGHRASYTVSWCIMI